MLPEDLPEDLPSFVARFGTGLSLWNGALSPCGSRIKRLCRPRRPPLPV
jgi:hypothetical protein